MYILTAINLAIFCITLGIALCFDNSNDIKESLITSCKIALVVMCLCACLEYIIMRCTL